MKFPGSKSKSHFLAIAYPACHERFTPGDPLRSQGQMRSLFRRQLCPRIPLAGIYQQGQHEFICMTVHATCGTVFSKVLHLTHFT
jgi:hypothetical protein